MIDKVCSHSQSHSSDSYTHILTQTHLFYPEDAFVHDEEEDEEILAHNKRGKKSKYLIS